jgi:hypothetical protein
VSILSICTFRKLLCITMLSLILLSVLGLPSVQAAPVPTQRKAAFSGRFGGSRGSTSNGLSTLSTPPIPTIDAGSSIVFVDYYLCTYRPSFCGTMVAQSVTSKLPDGMIVTFKNPIVLPNTTCFDSQGSYACFNYNNPSSNYSRS